MLVRRVATAAQVAAVSLLGLVAPEVARAQVLRLGPQFQINTYTTNVQSRPVVKNGSDGTFLVVWQSNGSAGTDTDGLSIQGQRYDKNGAPLGSQFQVNTYTTGGQDAAAVSSDSFSGDFVAVWTSEGSAGSDTDGTSIQGQRYDSAGSPVGSQFQINTYTTGAQSAPAVAASFPGFVVVWQSEGGDGTDTDASSIQAQIFDQTGAASGSQFQVNTNTTNVQQTPVVALDQQGYFVVAWACNGSPSDPFGFSIQAQKFSPGGTPNSLQFQVNADSFGNQVSPRLGGGLLAWVSDYDASLTDTDGTSIMAGGLETQGTGGSGGVVVNTYTTGNQLNPAVSADGTLVVWESTQGSGSDASGTSIQGRHLYSYSPTNVEFQVNTFTTSNQGMPAAGTDGRGNYLVVWDSLDGDGTDGVGSIQGQRYARERRILGKKMILRDRTGAEADRRAVILAKEVPTDVYGTFYTFDGDPTVDGATLRVIANGGTPSEEAYELDAAGWTAISNGYRYRGPTGVDGDPVKLVVIKVGYAAYLKVLLNGSLGTQPLGAVPPNPGTDGGMILTIHGGGTYCATYGGAAGGTELDDTTTQWRVLNPTLQPACP